MKNKIDWSIVVSLIAVNLVWITLLCFAVAITSGSARQKDNAALAGVAFGCLAVNAVWLAVNYENGWEDKE
jgi:hypothetical protein